MGKKEVTIIINLKIHTQIALSQDEVDKIL